MISAIGTANTEIYPNNAPTLPRSGLIMRDHARDRLGVCRNTGSEA